MGDVPLLQRRRRHHRVRAAAAGLDPDQVREVAAASRTTEGEVISVALQEYNRIETVIVGTKVRVYMFVPPNGLWLDFDLMQLENLEALIAQTRPNSSGTSTMELLSLPRKR